MSRSSSEFGDDETQTTEEAVLQYLPKMVINCPEAPIRKESEDPSKNPKEKLSHWFLYSSCVKLHIHIGYELSLKGQRVFRKMGRRIRDRDLTTIFAYIQEEDEIFSLDLSNNNITNEGFNILCDFLWESNLINLNLRNNDITTISEKNCEMLRKVSKLKRLTLSGNHLSLESALNLRAVLKSNKTLEVLDLDAVGFYVYNIHRIIDMIVFHNDTLRVLNISRLIGVPRYRLRSYYLSDVIYTLLVSNKSLVELHLEKNGITDHDVEKIAEALKVNRTLHLLNLTANYISNVGLEKIAVMLPQSMIEVLLLRSNTISNPGAIAFSKALPLSRIIHLDIAFNRIGEIGLANILWTVKKPIPLYTLYIFGNNITKQTLEIIHVQMRRGKILPDSLDILLYWEGDTIRFSYNPDADDYRKQMAGQYDSGHVAAKPNLLSYPIVNVFHCYETLERNIVYPKGSDPKIISHFKDHIAVK